MTVKEATRNVQDKIILLGCMILLGSMWISLAHDVESGKPFELNKKWYVATEVKNDKIRN